MSQSDIALICKELSSACKSKKMVACFEEYISNGRKIKEAMVSAGYSEKYAGQNSDKILKNTNFASAITKFGILMADKTLYTLEEAIEELEAIRGQAETAGQFSAAVSSVMGKAKLTGLDVQKVDVTSGGKPMKSFGDFYGD